MRRFGGVKAATSLRRAAKRRYLAAAVVWIVLSWSDFASAAQIRVPDDQPTVQAAINASASGDEIIVSPGTYREKINFGGKNIVLRSTDPLSSTVAATTIIDGHHVGSVVTFGGTELSTCVLSGFTITHGAARGGGGICGNGTHTTIRYNVICRNGVYAWHGGGGGIDNCQGLIESNDIFGNLVTGEEDYAELSFGGGLYRCCGIIRSNRIHGNRIAWTWGAEGGGLQSCGGIIENNLIYNNSVDGTNYAEGGGLNQCSGMIRNNTIYGNTAGGLAWCDAVVLNCIVWGNSGGQIWDSGLGPDPPPPRTYCCVQGGYDGEGNISSDPQLADPEHGDFHLLPGSPCIDAGGTTSLAQDFEGNRRPYDFSPMPRGDGSDFDIGADEFAPCIAFFPVALIDYAREGTDGATHTLEIWNAAGGRLTYTLQIPAWLTAVPAGGISDGPASRTTHLIGFRTATLPPGSYDAIVAIQAPDTQITPVVLPVTAKIGSLQIIAPATGDEWTAGMPGRLIWRSRGFCDRIYIYLQRPGLNRWLTIAATHEGTNTLEIRLPADVLPANDYRLWIGEDSCPTFVQDESDTFTILPVPTWAITWPARGTLWVSDTSATVRWNCPDVPPGPLDLELWKGSILMTTFARLPCRTGNNSAEIRLPAGLAMGSNYQLRLRLAGGTTVFVWSGYFSVVRGLIRVPMDHSTIQQAIDAATTGDAVLVSVGTYRENIHFRGKNILLASTEPFNPALVAVTIIDGHQAGSVVSFAGTEPSSCILSGFTITNGLADAGGGIRGNGTRATIQNNIILNNQADNGGGLIDCNGLIQNNVISRNSAVSDWYSQGGGLCSCGGVIQQNTISSNYVEGILPLGGGLYDCDGPIQNNVVTGNWGVVTIGYLGSEGGGFYGCDGLIRNNTITSNSADHGGGLVYCRGSIGNCIIWGNGGQLDEYSLPWYCCIEGWSGGGTGNISDDPGLADPANGDFHLLPTSPCVDAGCTVSLTQDFEGDPRPFDCMLPKRGDGSHFDIGADEFIPSSAYLAASVSSLNVWAAPGTDAATKTLTVWNAGPGSLSYTVGTAAGWLSAWPTSAVSDGPASRTAHSITFQTAGLAVGNYAATVTLTATGVANSPMAIPVSLLVKTPPRCAITQPATGTILVAGDWVTVAWTCVNNPNSDRFYLSIWKDGRLVSNWSSVPCHNGENQVQGRLPFGLAVRGAGYRLRLHWVVDGTVYYESGPIIITDSLPFLGVPFRQYRLYR